MRAESLQNLVRESQSYFAIIANLLIVLHGGTKRSRSFDPVAPPRVIEIIEKSLDFL